MVKFLRVACLAGMVLLHTQAFGTRVDTSSNVFDKIGNVISTVEPSQWFGSMFYAGLWTVLVGLVHPFDGRFAKIANTTVFLAFTGHYANKYYKANLAELAVKKD